MLFKQEPRTHLNTITRYGDGFFEINAVSYTHSIFLRPEGSIHEWPISCIEQMTLPLLEMAAGISKKQSLPTDFLEDEPHTQYENAPELVIIGTGRRQHFLPSAVISPLLQARIGVECMDSQAAARTYNILISEGRQVALGLIID